jgi:hypothetical protein
MANYNADLAQLDDGSTGAPRLSTAKGTTSVSQAEIDAAVRQAGIDLGVDPATLAYEAGLSGTTIRLNTLSPAELAAYQQGRRDKTTQARQTGDGTEPPSEAPEGTHWSFIGGAWKLYKDFEAPVVSDGTTPAITPVTPVVTPVTPLVTPVTPVTTVTPVTPAAATTAADTANKVNAVAALTATFNAMGLGSEIAASITDMVQRGYTTDTIMLIAQDPNSKDPVAVAFQKRFAGNAARIKAGLAPLAPAVYMATERAYRETLQAAGMPKGFYDSPDDYTNFIANDVSPTELKARVDTAADAVANADPFYVNSLKSMYGLTTGDMIAHALDPQMALPLLQKQQAAVKIGSAAAREGYGLSATAAENLYTQGVSQAQAEQGFRTVAGMQTAQQKLAEIYGGDTAAQGQNLVASTFGTAGAAYADQQIKALQQKQIGSFSGGSGVSKGSLGYGPEQTGGNL